jgi:hypothetical protein
MLSLLAVVFWFLFFSFLIYVIIRRRTVSMSRVELLIGFGTKVLFGCLYGTIFLQYYHGDDTWAMHANSIAEKNLLINNPSQFFREFTPGPAIEKGNDVIEIAGFYLTDLEYCLQAKILGIINFITRDNYYINIVFWNFIIFWGHFWLFTLLVKEFPGKRRFYFLLLFLLPPVVFWLSGIRADGLLFFSFALLLLHFQRWLHNYRLSSLILWITGFAGVLIFRREIALLLIPPLLCWVLTQRFPRKAPLHFIWVYSLMMILFFASTLFRSYNLPSIVAEKQHKFLQLKGTAFHLDTLQPSIKSFAAVLPQALANTFIRPFPWEAKGILQLSASIEMLFFWGVLMIAILLRDSEWKKIIVHPLLLLLFFFAASLYIFIGYTVPFPGAIVRYKIIGEVCFLAVFVSIVKMGANFRLK